MNMKKTIAAVAAGAVAVSAMATTVSALEAKTLTYNLVKTTKNQDAKGTVTATFTNVPLEAGGKVVIEPVSEYGAHSWDTVVTISGSFWDDTAGVNKSFTPVVATGMDWETGYSVEGSRLWNDTKVEVPVVAGTAQGTNVALKASSSAVITVTVKFGNLPDSVSYVGALNGLIKDGKVGIKLTSYGTPDANLAAKDCVATYKNVGGVTKAINVLNQTELNKLSGMTLTYDAATYKWTNGAANDASDITAASGVTFNGIPVSDMDKIRNNITVAPPAWMSMQSWAKGTYTLTKGTDGNWYDQSLTQWTVTTGSYTVSGTITVNFTPGNTAAATDMTETVNKALGFVQAVEDDDVITISKYEPALPGFKPDGTLYASPLSGAATETTANGEKKVPYHSALKNNTITNFNQGWYDGNSVIIGNDGSGNVLTWIGYASDDNKEWATQDHQAVSNAVMAVINDAVQNYDDVVFTFNTATSNVKIIRDQQGKITDYEYTGDAVKARENKDKGSEEIVNYTAFGRHYWDRDTGYDANTIYINNDWLGNNLFEGALVINNNLTLSLGATDKFDWTATSLSFSWDAIQDAALTQNQYANYIQTMILRTSTDWFWDNMTVTLGETETEEVDSGAPVEADDTDLPEDEVEEDLGDIEEEEEEEEPVEDVEPEPEPEPAPVEEATNPGTGNASVALAVIPVALAAAAIVAKKRG